MTAEAGATRAPATTGLANARVAGALFIIATVSAVVGGTLLLPTQGEDFATAAVANSGSVLAGALLEAVQALSVVGIAVFLFPILRRVHEGSALGFVGSRTMEGVLTLVGTIFALQVLSLSEESAADPSAGAIGQVLVAGREWAYLFGPTILFSVSAVLLYVLLLRGRLVPTWLSMWGLCGGILLMASGLIELLGADLGTTQLAFSAPIAVNEMVLAVWLMVKGLGSAGRTQGLDAPTPVAR